MIISFLPLKIVQILFSIRGCESLFFPFVVVFFGSKLKILLDFIDRSVYFLKVKKISF